MVSGLFERILHACISDDVFSLTRQVAVYVLDGDQLRFLMDEAKFVHWELEDSQSNHLLIFTPSKD